jgi:hypothetical protein
MEAVLDHGRVARTVRGKCISKSVMPLQSEEDVVQSTKVEVNSLQWKEGA